MTVIRFDPKPGRPTRINYRSEADRNAVLAIMSKTLRVIENAGTFRILEQPLDPARPSRCWPISFTSETGAELLRQDLISAAVDGVDNDACTLEVEWLATFYEFAGKVLDLIEADDSDSRDLAMSITREAMHHWTGTAAPADRGQDG